MNFIGEDHDVVARGEFGYGIERRLRKRAPDGIVRIAQEIRANAAREGRFQAVEIEIVRSIDAMSERHIDAANAGFFKRGIKRRIDGRVDRHGVSRSHEDT